LSEETEWLDWLVQNLGLSKIPRLVTPVVEPRPQPIEVPPQNETPSRVQTDPPSNEIQARIVDPRFDFDYHEMDPDEEASSTIVHRRRVSFQDELRTTEPFPSFDDTAVQANVTEPFPSFDEPVLQRNSTNPLSTLSPHDLLFTDRAGPRRRMKSDCIPCNRNIHFRRCDRKQPACGNCIEDPHRCYYSDSQDVPTSSSAGARQEYGRKVLNLPKKSKGATEIYVDAKAPIHVSMTTTTASATRYVLREGYADANVENFQDSAEEIDIDLVTKVSDKLAVSSTVVNPLIAYAQAHAPAPLSRNESLGLPEQFAEESVEPKESLFDLSEEFKSMLHECDSSDILQLIRDKWHHYSQWIEGAHMKWQSQEYISASIQLKNRIGTSLVRTTRGLLPLNETVLAKLDMQLDQSEVAPALHLHEPENTEWNLLANFGVVVKSDVHYFLRCLTTLSRDEAPDIDVVSYIYEQLQARYTGNEGLIR
jgi:hypothetical protein